MVYARIAGPFFLKSRTRGFFAYKKKRRQVRNIEVYTLLCVFGLHQKKGGSVVWLFPLLQSLEFYPDLDATFVK